MSDIALPRPEIWLPDYTKIGKKLKVPKWAKPWDTSTVEDDIVYSVAVDSAGNVIGNHFNGAFPTSPLTGSFTNTAGGLAVAGISQSCTTGASNISSPGTITYGGSTMTQLAFVRTGANNESWLAIYYLLNAPTGANTLSVGFSINAGSTSISVNTWAGMVTFTGHDTTTPISGSATSGSTGVNSISATTTENVLSGEMAFCVAGNGAGDTAPNTSLSGTSTVTQRFFPLNDSGTQLGVGIGGTQVGSGGTIQFTENWTNTDSAAIIVARIVAAASAPLAGHPGRMPLGV